MPKDKCQPIRDRIDVLETNIRDLEELLGEIPASMKPRIRAAIKREKGLLTQANRDLRNCERGR
jgi:hypothetical protein